MKRIMMIFLAAVLCVLSAGCESTSENKYLFAVGGEKCTMKEANLYLVNMRDVYSDDLGTDLWSQIDTSGDATAEEKLEDLVISRLLYIYCLDQMADAAGVTLSADEEDLIVQAAEAYYGTLTEADLSYLDVRSSELEEYYGHFALAEKYYEQETADVVLSEAASSEEEEAQMLAAAREEAIAAQYEAFIAGVEIAVADDPFGEDAEAAAEGVTTNQFFSVYNEYIAED